MYYPKLLVKIYSIKTECLLKIKAKNKKISFLGKCTVDLLNRKTNFRLFYRFYKKFANKNAKHFKKLLAV